MFRRRDVSELLDDTDDELDVMDEVEEDEADSQMSAMPTTAPQQQAPVQAAQQPQAVAASQPVAGGPARVDRKMTLADHFAEQAKPIARTFSRAPEMQRFEEQRRPMAPASKIQADASPKPQAKRILTVGPETCLKGEITHCDRVVIEGQVDAQVSEVDMMTIAQGGKFNGSASVGNAEINGEFDGELNVAGTLIIHETGSVKGKLSYGDIEVKRGGKVLGEINLSQSEKTVSFAKPKKKEVEAA